MKYLGWNFFSRLDVAEELVKKVHRNVNSEKMLKEQVWIQNIILYVI
jgi:hypothetical protein